MTWFTSSASTWAVVIFVAVLGASSAASLSHLDLVRLAMHSSVNTSLTWQHFWMATDATPPQPMIRAFPLCMTSCFRLFLVASPLWGRWVSAANPEGA